MTPELVQLVLLAFAGASLVGLAAVVFLLLFAGALVYYKHAFCENYDRSAAVPDSARRGT